MAEVKFFPNSVTVEEVLVDSLQYLNSLDEPSVSTNGKCSYRGVNDTMCVVGRYIPDEKYGVEMEGKTVIDLVRLSDKCLPYWAHTNEMVELLESLQDVHDASCPSTSKMFAESLMQRYEINGIDLEGKFFNNRSDSVDH